MLVQGRDRPAFFLALLEGRLLVVYAVHRAKEYAAADQVLHPTQSLPFRTYLELVGDLRAIRTECNEKRLAIGAHRKRMQYERPKSALMGISLFTRPHDASERCGQNRS